MSPNFNALLNAVVVAMRYYVPVDDSTTGAHAAAGQGTAAAVRGAAAHGAANVAAADVGTGSHSGPTDQQGLDGEVPTAAAPGASGVPLPSTSSVAGELNAADEPAFPPGLDIPNALRDTDSGTDAIENNDDGQDVDQPVAHHGPSSPPPPPFEDTRAASAAPEDSTVVCTSTAPTAEESEAGRGVGVEDPLDVVEARAQEAVDANPPVPRILKGPILLRRTDSTTDCVTKLDNGRYFSMRAGGILRKPFVQLFPPPPPPTSEVPSESSLAEEDSSIASASVEPAPPPSPPVVPKGVPLFRTESMTDCAQETDDVEYDRIRAREFYNRLIQRFPPPPTFDDPSENSLAGEDSSIASASVEPASPPSSPRVATGILLMRTESTSEWEMDDSDYDRIHTMVILEDLLAMECTPLPPFDPSEDFPTLPPDVIASVLPPLPVVTLEDLHSVPLVVPEDLFQSTRAAASTIPVEVGSATAPATAAAGSSGPVADAGPSDDEVFWANVQARAATVRFTPKVIRRAYRVRAHHVTPEDCQKVCFWKDHLESAASKRLDAEDSSQLEPEDGILPEPDVSSQPVPEDSNQLAPEDNDAFEQEEDEAIEPVDTNLLEAAARCAANKSQQLALLKALREKDLAKAPHLRENFVTGAELDTEFKLARVRERRLLTGAQVAFVAGRFYPEESTDPGTPPPSPPPSPPSPSPSRLIWTPGETGVLKRKHDADDEPAHRPVKRARVKEEQDPLPSFAFLRRLRAEPPPRPRRRHAETHPQSLPDDVEAAYIVLFSTSNVAMQMAMKPASTPVAGPSRQPFEAPPARKPSLVKTGASSLPASPDGEQRHVHFARLPEVYRLHRYEYDLPPPYMLDPVFGNAGRPAA